MPLPAPVHSLAGISPKRFLQFLTKENAKALLARASVLVTAYEAGLSSPSRLHDLFVQTEVVTPGEYKAGGAGVDIAYGFHPTPFGKCLLVLTARGICFLGFVERDRASALEELRQNWPNAVLSESPAQTGIVVGKIFSPQPGSTLSLHLNGTNFQIKVWEALLRLPPASVTTYQALAEQIGRPSAARAVGSAVARNPVAYLIPCHRVLRQIGEFGEFRYGSVHKKVSNRWRVSPVVPVRKESRVQAQAQRDKENSLPADCGRLLFL